MNFATELLDQAKAEIAQGNHQAASEMIECASGLLEQAAFQNRLEIVGELAAQATNEGAMLTKWRGLLAYAFSTGKGTADHMAFLNLLETAPDFDPQASISDRRRTDFFAWLTANRSKIRSLQNKIINALSEK